MAEKKEGDKVDWVRPVAPAVPIEKLDAQKLAKASEEHGVKIDINPDNKTATIIQEVVAGLPAPTTPATPPEADKKTNP